MPLGPKKALGTSWPSAATAVEVEQITPPSEILKTTKRDKAHEREVWRKLQQHIHDAVKDTAAPGKQFNGLGFRDHLKWRVNEACEVLKQIVLGGGPEEEPYNMLRMGKTKKSGRWEWPSY